MITDSPVLGHIIRGENSSADTHGKPHSDSVQKPALPQSADRLSIAVIGSGAAGLSSAWLLSKAHDVSLFETSKWYGGHAHTALVNTITGRLIDGIESQELDGHSSSARSLGIDTGFIVFNHLTYPNFTAWLELLGVPTQATDMSFAVSREEGSFEYAGGTLSGLFAQPVNILRPRFLKMLRDLVRFYREAVDESKVSAETTLGDFLKARGYGRSFIEDHLLPFGAAIWSTPAEKMLDYPLRSFVNFCDNHGLLKLYGRPQWRTVCGGSISYVSKVIDDIMCHQGCTFSNTGIAKVIRQPDGVKVLAVSGEMLRFDHVVFATHADQALKLIEKPTDLEKNLLGAFEYAQNQAVLHTDSRVMPKRRAAWSSWNYVETGNVSQASKPGVVYWMNRLQNLTVEKDYFVSLNTRSTINPQLIIRQTNYDHPLFNHGTHAAQQSLWQLQGKHNTWFCGSYFGSGFHEDAAQAGFAVAERLGGVRRPWRVSNESSRIVLPENTENYSPHA